MALALLQLIFLFAYLDTTSRTDRGKSISQFTALQSVEAEERIPILNKSMETTTPYKRYETYFLSVNLLYQHLKLTYKWYREFKCSLEAPTALSIWFLSCILFLGLLLLKEMKRVTLMKLSKRTPLSVLQFLYLQIELINPIKTIETIERA